MSLQRHGLLRLSLRSFSHFVGKWSLVALSRRKCRLTFRPKSRVAIWGRDTYITLVILFIWSGSIAGSFWSACDSCYHFFWIRSQHTRLCRYYQGKRFVLLAMAKDAQVEICGHILYAVAGCMEHSRKCMCHHGDEFFPLESTC